MHRWISKETLRRLLITVYTIYKETFDIRRSRVDIGRQIMNLRSEYVERVPNGKFSKGKNLLPISDRISDMMGRL